MSCKFCQPKVSYFDRNVKRKKLLVQKNNCVRDTRTQPLIYVGCCVHYWVSCAINKGEFFEIAFVSTNICLTLRRLLTFCLILTR